MNEFTVVNVPLKHEMVVALQDEFMNSTGDELSEVVVVCLQLHLKLLFLTIFAFDLMDHNSIGVEPPSEHRLQLFLLLIIFVLETDLAFDDLVIHQDISILGIFHSITHGENIVG